MIDASGNVGAQSSTVVIRGLNTNDVQIKKALGIVQREAILASVSGSALPFLFKALKFDPALMSAPFITTAVDVLGVVIYLRVARWILQLPNQDTGTSASSSLGFKLAEYERQSATVMGFDERSFQSRFRMLVNQEIQH